LQADEPCVLACGERRRRLYMGFDARKFMQLDAIAYAVVFVVIVVAAGVWKMLGLSN
jgi:hypothetical protein